jgi:hypothetical protein
MNQAETGAAPAADVPAKRQGPRRRGRRSNNKNTKRTEKSRAQTKTPNVATGRARQPSPPNKSNEARVCVCCHRVRNSKQFGAPKVEGVVETKCVSCVGFDKILASCGLTRETFASLAASQSNTCKICARQFSTRLQSRIDISAADGRLEPNAVVCRECHQCIMNVGKSAEMLLRAASYVCATDAKSSKNADQKTALSSLQAHLQAGVELCRTVQGTTSSPSPPVGATQASEPPSVAAQ